MKTVHLSSADINFELRYHLDMCFKCMDINDKYGFVTHFYGYRSVLFFLESYDWEFDTDLFEMYNICEDWFYHNIRMSNV